MDFETFQLLTGPMLVLIVWFVFGMYSDTAANHGRVVAFLLPLTPLFYLAVVLIFGLARVCLYPFFMLAGKKAQYEAGVSYLKSPYLWGYKADSIDKPDADSHE